MKNKNDYRETLSWIYEGRFQRNPSYSLAAFARDLGMGRSTLSMVLKKERSLSKVMAEKVVCKLGLSDSQTKSFLKSVQDQMGATAPFRQAKEDAPPLITNIPARSLTFEITWRHWALREYVSLADFQCDPQWISSRLNVSTSEADKLWKQCLSGNLISKNSDGTYVATEHLVIGDRERRADIRQMHRELLTRAMDKIESPQEERALSAILFSVSEEQFQEVRRLVRNFNSELSRAIKTSDENKKDRVLCLSTQIFSV